MMGAAGVLRHSAPAAGRVEAAHQGNEVPTAGARKREVHAQLALHTGSRSGAFETFPSAVNGSGLAATAGAESYGKIG